MAGAFYHQSLGGMGGVAIAAKPETVDFQLVPDASGEETSLAPNPASNHVRVRFLSWVWFSINPTWFWQQLVFLADHWDSANAADCDGGCKVSSPICLTGFQLARGSNVTGL